MTPCLKTNIGFIYDLRLTFFPYGRVLGPPGKNNSFLFLEFRWNVQTQNVLYDAHCMHNAIPSELNLSSCSLYRT